MSKTEQLAMEVRSLPETIAGEVLDFLNLLKGGARVPASSRAAEVRKIRGSWKGKLSTSAEFAANKADEIRLEQ
jgi:hypothetical protein